MVRQKKAPEFQCHIKYKNDLPLPPVSSVLFDTSLTLPRSALNEELRSESTKYSPTTLENGMKYYTLPAELLKMDVYNMVDIGRINKGGASVPLEDKEILLPIEELERKFTEIESNSSGSKVSTTAKIASSVNSPSPSLVSVNQKISRPDVTWLRRTEYISSVKHNNNNNSNNSNSLNTSEDADAKAFLSAAVTFEQICGEVSGTFEGVKNGKHPIKPDHIEIIKSFPIQIIQNDEDGSFSHCLFFGDANENSLILQNDSNQIVSNLYVPVGNLNQYKFNGEFDVQKSENVKNNFVLLLPLDENVAIPAAQISKINSTFSLRKRRSTTSKVSKRIKVNRK